MIHHDNNRRLVEALAMKRDPDTLAKNVVLRDQAQERSFHGRAAAIDFLEHLFIQGFSSARVEVQTVVVDHRQVALAFLFRGRQDGPFMGIPPTRQEVAVPMVLLCHIDEGQIQEIALYYNAGTLLRQLGLG